MAKKEFSKFFVASLKRTAQNVYPLVKRKTKLIEEIKTAQQELESIQVQIDGYQGPIKKQTGGYSTEDLITREVVDTGKVDDKGRAIKSTVYKLTYPETIVPEVSDEEAVALAEEEAMAEASANPSYDEAIGNGNPETL